MEEELPPQTRTTAGGGAAVVVSAALAMAATLPGRTHGLGLATTRLLADIPDLTPADLAPIDTAATLAGSLLRLPCGWLIDRVGIRPVLAAVMLALAATVGLMARAGGVGELAAGVSAAGRRVA